MNSYNERARKFLEDSCTRVEISLRDCKPVRRWHDTEPRNNYNVRVIRKGVGMWNYTFHDSIYHTQHNIRPTAYDVLSCVQTYDVGSLSDFISEFGYDPEFDNVEQTYKAVCKEYQNWERMFGDLAEEFNEVFQ